MKGKIKRIKIMHKPLLASCGFTIKVKHFGHYPLTGSVAAEDSFVTILGPQGNTLTSGFSQSTTNATFTVLEDLDKFKTADFAQIEIDFDETSGSNSAEILFNIIVETIPTEGQI